MIVRPRRCRTLLVVIAVTLGAGVLAARVPGPLDKSLFVAVVDADGRPVKGVVLGDLLILAEEKDSEVMAIKPASQPISVAVLVDTAQARGSKDAYGPPKSTSGPAASPLAVFAKQLLMLSPDASVMLMEFGQAAIRWEVHHRPLAFDKGVNALSRGPAWAPCSVEARRRRTRTDRSSGHAPRDRDAHLEPSGANQSFDNANSIKDAFRSPARNSGHSPCSAAG